VGDKGDKEEIEIALHPTPYTLITDLALGLSEEVMFSLPRSNYLP